MRDIPALCLLIASLAASGAGSTPCRRGRSWWDRERGLCVPCTRCDPQNYAVQYPCELHRDTVCLSLYQVRISFENYNASELDSDYSEPSDIEVKSDDNVKWDIQTSALTLAACGCVVFFLVVLTLTLSHAKQWRVIKHALKSDVQDLSAKLKLMEAGGDNSAEPVVATDHHIYCNIHVGKEALLGSAATKKGLGNVYTQEKHPS